MRQHSVEAKLAYERAAHKITLAKLKVAYDKIDALEAERDEFLRLLGGDSMSATNVGPRPYLAGP